MRSYTIQEIDALRQAAENKFLWGSYFPVSGCRVGRAHYPEEKLRFVEETTRTHMLAGITAENLRNPQVKE